LDEYQSQFEVLSNRIFELTKEFKGSMFISGLKEEVRIIVTMLKQPSLPTTFGLARLQDERSGGETEVLEHLFGLLLLLKQ
jgi:hypothetical protein